jgi:hypothetical protein
MVPTLSSANPDFFADLFEMVETPVCIFILEGAKMPVAAGSCLIVSLSL